MDLDMKDLDYKSLIKSQNASGLGINEKKVNVIEYDYKIVSFKIGNEYYGIDIMNVKEILKENKFTRVPNTFDYVVGVYNLRGEIIPVIDLAKMFNLKKTAEKSKNNDLKSIIVIKIENLLIGIVVEQIQRVIPLKKTEIQPPSPLLGSINEKYIKGVAQISNKLYVLFDTDEIFSSKEKSKKDVLPQISDDLFENFFIHFSNQIEGLSGIHISEFNKLAFRNLYTNYVETNKITDLPTFSKEISDGFLHSFYSKFTGRLWDKPYIEQFANAAIKELKNICSDEVRILIAGCGNGHEAVSLFFIFDKYFEGVDIKMVATDVNLASVSNASGFEILKDEIPSWIDKNKYFIKLDEKTFKIKKEINNKIYFEFHDARNIRTYNREFDIVVARDLSLNLPEDLYKKFIDDVSSKIVNGGVLVIGDNENIVKHPRLLKIEDKNIKIYKNNKGD